MNFDRTQEVNAKLLLYDLLYSTVAMWGGSKSGA